MSSKIYKIGGFAVDLSEVTDIEYFKGRYVGENTYVGIKGCDRRRQVALSEDQSAELIQAWIDFKNNDDLD